MQHKACVEMRPDVEQGQRPAGEHADTVVVQVQIDADRLEHRRHDISVGDVDRVDQAHQDEDVPALDR